ncbi:uncharacterized protein LOC135094686 [Scylla paramamosain]|uniref:uncharacterized protein LOC135094686 n=1 Tax=Scylla paramamosain TaxID=85552 RepID=UPI0030839E7F
MLPWMKRERIRLWTRPWVSRRGERSVYHTLLPELSEDDQDTIGQWLRLNREQYHGVLQLVTPFIRKEDTHMRDAVTPGEHLTLTLRYLPTIAAWIPTLPIIIH